MGFMLAVLGSNLFWVGYGILTIIATAVLLKKLAPYTYSFIIGEGYASDHFDKFEYFMATLLILVFWPIITFWLVFFFFLRILLDLVRQALGWAFRTVEKLTPDINIKIGKED